MNRIVFTIIILIGNAHLVAQSRQPSPQPTQQTMSPDDIARYILYLQQTALAPVQNEKSQEQKPQEQKKTQEQETKDNNKIEDEKFSAVAGGMVAGFINAISGANAGNPGQVTKGLWDMFSAAFGLLGQKKRSFSEDQKQSIIAYLKSIQSVLVKKVAQLIALGHHQAVEGKQGTHRNAMVCSPHSVR